MKLNKGVAAMILSVSSTGFAIVGPQRPTAIKTYCLEVYEDSEGVKYLSGCDASANNASQGLELLANGCAENQVALTASKYGRNRRFDIEIGSCLPPNVAQL